MKKYFMILLTAALVLACDEDWYTVGAGRLLSHRDGAPGGPYGNSVDGGPDGGVPHLYVCGVRYPEGYDWRKDEQKGSVDCTLFLLRDNEAILEIPVGEATLAVSDSDMHRILRGHLYADYISDEASFVQKDGEVVYSVKTREYVHSMILRGEEVLSLCRKCDGSGWTLRSDGSQLASGSDHILHGLCYADGTPQGSVHESGSGRPFQFSTISGRTLSYWLDGRVDQTREAREDVGVYDASIARNLSLPWFTAYYGSKSYVFFPSLGSNFQIGYNERYVALMGDQSQIYALTNTSANLGRLYRVEIRQSPVNLWSAADGEGCALAISQEGQWKVLQKGLDGRFSIVDEGRTELLPEGAEPYSKELFFFQGGKLFLPLQIEGKAALYVDGEIRRYDFNGYVDGAYWGTGS
ncbi:MAG: hypothetical protein J6Y32_05225 [Bacteroidales bacterium]|nr:hypothetical protein [Bacteroidales bacterium]